ncbi:MAG: hypothetical protein B6U94_05990 [Thermofilum sp. ex4484_79]|nr:MAG: hypothetical protein B6U94_05990 [Thermofilum sp. ex4484_79]
MTYSYRIVGLGQYYRKYFDRLLNNFSTAGIEVMNRTFSPQFSEINVRHEHEVANIKIYPQYNDLLVTFEVKEDVGHRTLEFAKTGLRFFGSILTGGSVVDATISTVEESFDNALSGNAGYLASTVANIIKSTEDSLRHEVEERIRQVRESMEEVNNLATSVRSRIITIQEELDILKSEGKDVSKIELRVNRAKQLYDEAMSEAGRRNYMNAIAKLEAASRLLDRAEGLLSEVY